MNPYGPFFNLKELGDPQDPRAQENLLLLVKYGLNPIRHKYGPVIITSGYRTPEKNASLPGASATSQHPEGAAVDFYCQLVEGREVFEWLRTWWPGQLFYYQDKKHIHIGLPNLKLALAGRLYSMVK